MTHPPGLHALKARVDTALGWLLAALMGLAVVNVLWQVFTRYVMGSPSAYTDELSRYLLIWVGLVGAAYAAGKRMHLAIDILPSKLRGRAREALLLVIEAAVFLFAAVVMVFGGARLVALQLMLEQTSAALRVPLGYVYLALPVSGLLMMFYAALLMIDNVRALRGQPHALPEAEKNSADALAEAEIAGAEAISEPPSSPRAARR
jgi:TRAP-type C4-dicarboxylate transport system permease small subunit